MDRHPVRTLEELEDWNAEEPSLAVLGRPVAHSLSPVMHAVALARLAREDAAFGAWRYHKFDVPPERLAEALPLFHARGFLGINLTIPHKVLAVGLVRAIDPFAADAGAVNTLRRRDDGYEGFNTDGHGVARAITDELGTAIRGSHVVVLGAGGAARATAVTCLAERCASLAIGNRTPANLEALLSILRPLAGAAGTPVRGFDPSRPPADLPADALVINATSAGLAADDPPPIDLGRLRGAPMVYDMIYNPPATELLRAAAARGLRAANGLSMLAHQGARSLEIWTGRSVPAAPMLAACRAALRPTGPSGVS